MSPAPSLSGLGARLALSPALLAADGGKAREREKGGDQEHSKSRWLLPADHLAWPARA